MVYAERFVFGLGKIVIGKNAHLREIFDFRKKCRDLFYLSAVVMWNVGNTHLYLTTLFIKILDVFKYLFV